jgi:hypothetical protein
MLVICSMWNNRPSSRMVCRLSSRAIHRVYRHRDYDR